MRGELSSGVARGPEGGASAEGIRSTTYLHPGRLFVSPDPVAVTTILGSCVAVCLFDPVARVGGVSHHVLHHGPEDATDSLRFGSVAVPELIEQVLGIGAKREKLRAKLFGGARVLGPGKKTGLHLGAKNVEVARQLLSAFVIPVVAEDVGGQRGRKLIFHTEGGRAWVRTV
jgi:chemotaxis protein CheD